MLSSPVAGSLKVGLSVTSKTKSINMLDNCSSCTCACMRVLARTRVCVCVCVCACTRVCAMCSAASVPARKCLSWSPVKERPHFVAAGQQNGRVMVTG